MNGSGMVITNRDREAIKQTRIVIEQTDRPEPLEFLEGGREQLENASQALEVRDTD